MYISLASRCSQSKKNPEGVRDYMYMNIPGGGIGSGGGLGVCLGEFTAVQKRCTHTIIHTHAWSTACMHTHTHSHAHS